MLEIPISDKIRIFLPGKGDNCAPQRFFISRQDAFLVMCSQCGGTVNIVYHVILGESMLPLQNPCTCSNKGKEYDR